jgi:hypothetical protein
MIIQMLEDDSILTKVMVFKVRMFKANDTVFVDKIGGVSGRVVDYNP